MGVVASREIEGFFAVYGSQASLDPCLAAEYQPEAPLNNLGNTDLDANALRDGLYRSSGLRALAGTPDMRVILDRALHAHVPDAALALRVFVRRACVGIAAMAVSLGGLDVLAFTGGIGENAPEVRARIAASLRFLGVRLDETNNYAVDGDAEISAPASRVRSVVVRAQEDREIARQVMGLVVCA